jgi:hypothetical protein
MDNIPDHSKYDPLAPEAAADAHRALAALAHNARVRTLEEARALGRSRTCTVCHTEKPLSQFSPSRRDPTTHEVKKWSPRCHVCAAQWLRIRRASKPRRVLTPEEQRMRMSERAIAEQKRRAAYYKDLKDNAEFYAERRRQQRARDAYWLTPEGEACLCLAGWRMQLLFVNEGRARRGMPPRDLQEFARPPWSPRLQPIHEEAMRIHREGLPADSQGQRVLRVSH